MPLVFPIAVLVGIALARFVEIRAPGGIQRLINWTLMAIVGAAAHRLTWDYVDRRFVDASGGTAPQMGPTRRFGQRETATGPEA
jgi:hypothetical protein